MLHETKITDTADMNREFHRMSMRQYNRCAAAIRE